MTKGTICTWNSFKSVKKTVLLAMDTDDEDNHGTEEENLAIQRCWWDPWDFVNIVTYLWVVKEEYCTLL